MSEQKYGLAQGVGDSGRSDALRALDEMKQWSEDLWRNAKRAKRYSDDGVTQDGAGHIADAVDRWLKPLRAAITAPLTPAEGVDLSNHHNALKCPYCNPNGLEFARPAPEEGDVRPDARLIYDLGETYRVTGDKVFHQAAERLQQLVSQVENARKQALVDAMKAIEDLRIRAATNFTDDNCKGQRGVDRCDALGDAYRAIVALPLTSTNGEPK